MKNNNTTSSNFKLLLNQINVDELDLYEQRFVADFMGKVGKTEALQLLINSVEGEYSQLSPVLAELGLQMDLFDYSVQDSSQMEG